MTLGALGARLVARTPAARPRPPWRRGRTLGGVLATQCERPAALPLRGRARPAARRALRAGRRRPSRGAARKVVKSVTGYDVPKLLVGSLGTLGVIVGATLRLHPLPAAEASWLCASTRARGGADFVAALLDVVARARARRRSQRSARLAMRSAERGPARSSCRSRASTQAVRGAGRARSREQVARARVAVSSRSARPALVRPRRAAGRPRRAEARPAAAPDHRLARPTRSRWRVGAAVDGRRRGAGRAMACVGIWRCTA